MAHNKSQVSQLCIASCHITFKKKSENHITHTLTNQKLISGTSQLHLWLTRVTCKRKPQVLFSLEPYGIFVYLITVLMCLEPFDYPRDM